MSKIFLIKKLREYTGMSIMLCKQVLDIFNNDFELAVNYLNNNQNKTYKKPNCITNSGVISIKTNINHGVIIEVNCQTDFVARSKCFQIFVNKLTESALDNKISNLEKIRICFEEECSNLSTKMGEQINIRRFSSLSGSRIGGYLHNNRIGVLVSAEGLSDNLIKQIAMHITASKPKIIGSEKISKESFKQECNQNEINNEDINLMNDINKDHMQNSATEISLVNQLFIMNPNKTVGQILREYNALVTKFIRFELNENIE